MRPALTKGDLAAGLRRILAELEADPEAAGYELAFEICPGVPLETPTADAVRKRLRRLPNTRPPTRPPTRPNTRPNTRPSHETAESKSGPPPEVRPAPLEPSIHARGIRIPGSVSGSGSEIPKETAVVAKEPDRSTREAGAAAAAMTADWNPPDTLLAQLEMMPGIPRPAGLVILRRAALHFAQDESVRKSPAQWRQIMSRWACRAWQDPKERAAAQAATSTAPKVGGFHEGPVERLDPPKEWTEAVRRPVMPAPPEALALLERLKAEQRAQLLPPVGGADRPAPGSLARARAENGEGGGHG